MSKVIFFVVGGITFLVGVWMVYPPAALMLGGLVLVAFSLVADKHEENAAANNRQGDFE